MQFSEAYHYLTQSLRREKILLGLIQPMTARQLSLQTGLNPNVCSSLLWELLVYEVVTCLNKPAKRSRLYWLTELGKTCQARLLDERGMVPQKHELPDVDWNLYGWLCYNHRRAVIKSLEEKAIWPARIKTNARRQDPLIRMNPNNIRDVLKLFLERGIVNKVTRGVVRKHHPRYELTELGKKLKSLLP